MPEQKVDVLMTVPGGSMEMLQEEIRKQFGLVAARKMREGDVLAVTVRNSEVPGLKLSEQQSPPNTVGGGGFGSSSSTSRVYMSRAQGQGSGGGVSVRSAAAVGSNKYTAEGQTIESLIQNLQSSFDETLYDETGLTGNYDISLEWPSGDGAAARDALKAAMLNQLGLELVPGRAEVEMLVVRKAE
jgi:uncharacterized protein (TIGR03435 family)